MFLCNDDVCHEMIVDDEVIECLCDRMVFLM